MLVANSPLLLLKSPFGNDTLPNQRGTLHAIELTAIEQISRPFEFELTVVSDDPSLDPNQLLHQPVSVTCRRFRGLDRCFSGLVRKVDTPGTAQRDRWRYKLVVVPRLWFLSQTVDCRIFQQMTAKEILTELFKEHGVEPVDYRIFGPQRKRTYTTQFNETDLDFVHRLLQESGYFYFFVHDPDGSTLVITDRNNGFRTMERPVHRVSHAGNNVDILDRWEKSQQTAYGRVRLQDYDPTRPNEPVLGQRTTVLKAAGTSNRDVFRWPAMTLQDEVAADRARFRMEAAEADASLRQGHGYDPNLCPGGRFILHLDPSSNARDVLHVVQAVRHRAADSTWLDDTTPSSWDSEFTCFLDETPWREDLSVPRPVMSGIYSGVVLGFEGEEIHTDKLARIKVRPLFDHREDTRADEAIWIRVLSAWAGDDRGWQHIPRVGMEVGISFMNGDPDNPVVVGCFYNENRKPPFDTEAEKTVQGFRSRSTLNGDREEYSELSFDDKRGEEVVLLHAQKDHRVEVENNQDDTIGNDRTVKTANHDSLTARDVSITASRSITLQVVGAGGSSSITMTPTNITVSSKTVTVAALGVVSVDALADVNVNAIGDISLSAIGDVNIFGLGAVTVETGDGSPVTLLPDFV